MDAALYWVEGDKIQAVKTVAWSAACDTGIGVVTYGTVRAVKGISRIARPAVKASGEVIGATAEALLRKLRRSGDDLIDAGRRQVGETAEGIAKSPDAPVIIGETMERVKIASKQYPDAIILNDMPEFWNMGLKDHEVTSRMMEYNRRWIFERMKEGRTIIDIGIDSNRSIPSIFYQMERLMLKNYDVLHPNTLNVFRP